MDNKGGKERLESIVKNDLLLDKYQKLVIFYAIVQVIPVLYFQAGVLVRNGEVLSHMSAMYSMIALLSLSLFALLQWSYSLMFGQIGILR